MLGVTFVCVRREKSGRSLSSRAMRGLLAGVRCPAPAAVPYLSFLDMDSFARMRNQEPVPTGSHQRIARFDCAVHNREQQPLLEQIDFLPRVYRVRYSS
jgi:hypothetical protein